MLPLVVLVALVVGELLAAGMCEALAGHAAEAGAVAIAEGGNPRTAARAALPGWSRRGLSVKVHGTRVTVRLRPPAPFGSLGDALAARAHADAGTASR
jgi:hypothetical protein